MGQPSSRGRCRGSSRAHAWSTRQSHRVEISTIRSDRGSRIVQIHGRICSNPLSGERAGGRRGPPAIIGARDEHVDGVLGMQSHGGKDLLEPRPVEGSDRGLFLIPRPERDPVAAAVGRDDREVTALAADASRGAVDGDRLGFRASLDFLPFRHLLRDPILGRGVADRLRGEGRGTRRSSPRPGASGGRPVGYLTGSGQLGVPSRARSPLR